MDYPLKTLMEMRIQQRDAAEQAYAAVLKEQETKQKVVEEAKVRKQGREDDLQRARQESGGLRHSDFTMADMAVHRAYEAAMKHELALANQELEAAQKVRDAHQKIVSEHRRVFEDAQKELMAVEKHLESWKDEQKVERERRDADQLDEIAIRLWRNS